MCGRFTLHTSAEKLVERFSLQELNFLYTPSYNVAPTQNVFTISSINDSKVASLMSWGLVPPWLKQGQSRPPLINARLETLTEKPTFRRLINNQRCLIIADGFYEWKIDDSQKYPVYITLDEGKPFAFAGLWDDSSPNPSCTIITQEATDFIKPIHHRMPVILTPETERLWLSPIEFSEIRNQLPDQTQRPFKYHRVSTLVNSPKNNEVACTLPFEQQSLF